MIAIVTLRCTCATPSGSPSWAEHACFRKKYSFPNELSNPQVSWVDGEPTIS